MTESPPGTGTVPGTPILSIQAVSKAFPGGTGVRDTTGQVKAVDNVTLDIYPGETFGVVGESGSGKSTLARCIVRLLEPTAGAVIFRGTTLGQLQPKAMREMRRELQMVFQDPFASLDPRMTAEELVEEPLAIHRLGDRSERRGVAREMLARVGLGESYAGRRPRELSGGQRQRVAIACALVLNPAFVALDEPVTALDVSVQAQVLNLLRELQTQLGLTYLFVVHDLLVAEYFCDRLAVMYRGVVVETGTREAVFHNLMHPYTAALLEAAPRVGASLRRRMRPAVPDDQSARSRVGCVFQKGCQVGRDRDVCGVIRPELQEHHPGHWAACHFPGEVAQRV